MLPERQLALLRKVGQYYLRAPYVWGGKSVFGLDCSGLTQQLFGLLGIQLPRDARQQIALGEPVDFVTQAPVRRPGFFSTMPTATSSMSAWCWTTARFCTPTAKCALDPLDHNGIFNRDRQRYSHKLRLIKRLL